MADISEQEMAAKLMSDGFGRTGPVAGALTDPVADTPMVVTLDELRPYELNPRLTRNPLYDEIKASIRERGLDAPPPITRRPGSAHYIIRNGGNTRLAILRELWTETKDERFFRIGCLFRPWPERGEIVALTGHLAENELHGSLSFIERALGVEKVRELYEQEDGKSLSQSELARRLKADGYPVPQPHISRMQEAIQYLLPVIPSVLYGGLGRHQVEQLTGLRRAGARIWEARAATKQVDVDFATLFQDVLAVFDGSPGNFNIQRVQDELIGQMADLLGVLYDTLALEIVDSEKRWQVLTSEPAAAPPATPAVATLPQAAPAQLSPPTPSTPPQRETPVAASESSLQTKPSPVQPPAPDDQPDDESQRSALLQEHIVSPVPTTDRLQSIQRLIADHTGEAHNDFESNVLQAIPVQVGGLYPISDVWHIDPGLDEPDRLRTHIAQFALEIASEAGVGDYIVPSDDGIGFSCATDIERMGSAGAMALPGATLTLLHVLSAPYLSASASSARIDTSRLAGDLAVLLLGMAQLAIPSRGQSHVLTDNGLVKLFRLVRLSRRLLEIEAGTMDGDSAMPGS
ncbi:TPA: ParB family protein [Pseudomonas aeruginosa]|uniref:ParB family protein n=1 Tax=Pseudomonas aeruginosa TaxID=287 RepID=UPI0003B95171|nr:ParB family protein [Pseudomonas aeruginosa]EKT9494448.1 ParB family protein [Pseudomonas aeruginosa]ERY35639.1 integrating conjugative element, PFGI_1 class, ParB family protein [Pseudomonas aeruginosa BL13]MBH4028493.1 ParB family protein [Pseudomonas aeruginosa]MBV5530537.1 ParB family protein [Pseudomonas aeruginosa]MCS8095418.1 ParB family protein [Pseudomonas aeruginosa]